MSLTRLHGQMYHHKYNDKNKSYSVIFEFNKLTKDVKQIYLRQLFLNPYFKSISVNHTLKLFL